MSLNTSIPFIRNTSREVKTIREIIQNEVIKSARLTSRDKVKIKQNTSIGDLNRSKRKVNHSFYDNRSSSQIENQNVLSSYLANAFQEKKENHHHQQAQPQYQQQIYRQQLQDIQNKPKQEENKQKDVKYLMRIAELEKENQKLNQALDKLKKENNSLKQNTQLEGAITQLKESLQASKQENASLKKYITQLQNTTKKQEQRINTSQTLNTINSTQKQKDFIPSYMVALSLAN